MSSRLGCNSSKSILEFLMNPVHIRFMAASFAFCCTKISYIVWEITLTLTKLSECVLIACRHCIKLFVTIRLAFLEYEYTYMDLNIGCINSVSANNINNG